MTDAARHLGYDQWGEALAAVNGRHRASLMDPVPVKRARRL